MHDHDPVRSLDEGPFARRRGARHGREQTPSVCGALERGLDVRASRRIEVRERRLGAEHARRAERRVREQTTTRFTARRSLKRRRAAWRELETRDGGFDLAPRFGLAKAGEACAFEQVALGRPFGGERRIRKREPGDARSSRPCERDAGDERLAARERRVAREQAKQGSRRCRRASAASPPPRASQRFDRRRPPARIRARSRTSSGSRRRPRLPYGPSGATSISASGRSAGGSRTEPGRARARAAAVEPESPSFAFRPSMPSSLPSSVVSGGGSSMIGACSGSPASCRA